MNGSEISGYFSSKLSDIQQRLQVTLHTIFVSLFSLIIDVETLKSVSLITAGIYESVTVENVISI